MPNQRLKKSKSWHLSQKLNHCAIFEVQCAVKSVLQWIQSFQIITGSTTQSEQPKQILHIPITKKYSKKLLGKSP